MSWKVPADALVQSSGQQISVWPLAHVGRCPAEYQLGHGCWCFLIHTQTTPKWGEDLSWFCKIAIPGKIELQYEYMRRRTFPLIDFRDIVAGRVAYVKGTRLAVYWLAHALKGMDSTNLVRFLQRPRRR